MSVLFFLYLFTRQWTLGYFHLLAVMGLWTWVCIYFFKTPFSILWDSTLPIYILTYIQKWYCCIIRGSIFNFLRNGHTIFYSCCIILRTYQRYIKVPISPHLRNVHTLLILNYHDVINNQVKIMRDLGICIFFLN